MRVDNHIHIRHIMLYHYQKGWRAAQSFRDLNELFGEGTISQSQVERWFKKFKSGNTNLEDDEGRGRPSDFDDQALLTAVEEDECLTTRILAEDFNVDQSTIVRRLTAANMPQNNYLNLFSVYFYALLFNKYLCQKIRINYAST